MTAMHQPNPDVTIPITNRLSSLHRFRLILSGNCDPFEEISDRLFEAGCDDASFGISAGEPDIAFMREATTLRDAIGSAIRDVFRAGVGLEVVRVESEDAPTEAEEEEIGKINSILALRRRRASIDEVESLWAKFVPSSRLGNLDPEFPAFPPEEREVLKKIAVEGSNTIEGAVELGMPVEVFRGILRRAMYRLHEEPSCRSALECFRMVEVPGAGTGTKGRSVLQRTGDGTAMLVGLDVRYFYECARCDAPLIMGFDVERSAGIQHIICVCNRCGAYNAMPDQTVPSTVVQ
jgi:hypothetical protein